MIRRDGRARRLGDNVNTDYIISSRRKRDTIDEQVLKQWLLETLDPAFAASVRDGDIIVAGHNFGCGSAMEIAVTVILAAGIKAVVAPSYSRTFYRNAINNGLIAVQCETAAIDEGDALVVTLDGETLMVSDPAKGLTLRGQPITGIMLDILGHGGLVPYMREHRTFAQGAP
jgi:3-isopropylmalate/(R)-2-methylmalate dehydratase small subunit